MLKTNRTNPIFHTKLAFLRGFFGTKTLENCLILLRFKQHIQGKHKLKFWLKNIHEFQNCSTPFSFFHLLPSKNNKNWSFLVQFWNLWLFLSQNFSLCLPCIYCLNPRRIKQFSNVFVLKRPLKNAIFVWKMGFVRFVLSTTVTRFEMSFRNGVYSCPVA